MMAIKLINYAKMRTQFIDNNTLFLRFAEKYLNSFANHLKDLEEILEVEDRPALKRKIHEYKNLVCNFHCSVLNSEITAFEKVTVEGKKSDLFELLSRIKQNSKLMADEIEILKNSDNPMGL